MRLLARRSGSMQPRDQVLWRKRRRALLVLGQLHRTQHFAPGTWRATAEERRRVLQHPLRPWNQLGEPLSHAIEGRGLHELRPALVLDSDVQGRVGLDEPT